MKKNSNLQELMGYAGGHRYLAYLSLLLSAISAILALFPFVFLFRIIREVIEVAPNYAQATHIVRNGWMAVGFAVLSIVIYVCALMSSHLSAFRIAGNIRKALMAHIAELPLGFIGETGSGKIRRIVSDSSAATETYLAHQLPDMSAAVTTPVCMIVMLFLFDWRFGLVSLLPVILGFAAMFKMAGPSMAEDMKLYQNALADMNNEAVEYVRGVPVVKTFGQTVHSFKRFKGTIDSYYDFVMSYCKKCRPSMLSYTVLVNSAFAFLIVLMISANFYEALTGLNLDPEGANIEFIAEWSPTVEDRSGVESKISLTHDYYQPIETVTRKLKKKVDTSTRILGRINKLESAPDVSKRKGGRITVIYLDEDEKKKTVTVQLEKSDHSRAIEAHDKGLYVEIVGSLIRSGRATMTCEMFSVID